MIDRIARWLVRQFPSSRGGARIFNCEADLLAATGESYNQVCVIDKMLRGGGVLFHETSFSFCLDQEVRSFRFYLQRTLEGEVTLLRESIKRTDPVTGKWALQLEHYYADPAKTEEWQFVRAMERFEQAVQKVLTAQGYDIPRGHPVLNTFGISKGRHS